MKYYFTYAYSYATVSDVMCSTSSHKQSELITDVVAQLQDIVALKQEHFICFSLNSAHEVTAKRTIFIGTLTGVLAHPREIFAAAIEDHAAAIIVAHNHPSGDPHPSSADITMTQQFVAAGLILGIPLEDHVIVAGKKHFSFQQQGLIAADIHKNKGGYE